MLFVSLNFAAFFTAFLVVYRWVARTPEMKVAWVTVGSIFFYATWDARYVPLLVIGAAVDYYLAMVIGREERTPRKLAALWVSVVLNLGALVYYKYLGLFATAIPVGISFYSFQRLAYMIDVYTGEMKPCRSLVKFLACVTFFPHLVAGPIIRANVILPQLEQIRVPPWSEWREAALLIATGFLKKSLADLLAGRADTVFSMESPSTLDAWVGTLAFVGQIYGDFSGYTDMAIGIALIMGFRLPPNFNLPFLARSPAEFWSKHWHLSLTSWIRDYVYLPIALWIGRKRPGPPLLAILLTMTLMGLWHGGAWTFVVFGLYQGTLVAGTHFLGRKVATAGGPAVPGWLAAPAQVALTFYLMAIGFMIFRSESVPQIGQMLQALHGGVARGAASLPQLRTVVGSLLLIYAVGYLVERFKRETIESPLLTTLACGFLAAAGGLIALFSNQLGIVDQPFIYFRF